MRSERAVDGGPVAVVLPFAGFEHEACDVAAVQVDGRRGEDRSTRRDLVAVPGDVDRRRELERGHLLEESPTSLIALG